VSPDLFHQNKNSLDMPMPVIYPVSAQIHDPNHAG